MKLPHEEEFESRNWLSWQRDFTGGLVTRPIERPGGASWLKSKLAGLGVEATIITGEKGGIEVKMVSIPASELAAFCLRNSGTQPAQLGLIKDLKLHPLLVHGMAR